MAFNVYSQRSSAKVRAKRPNNGLGREGGGYTFAPYDSLLALPDIFPLKPVSILVSYQQRQVSKIPSKPNLPKMISIKMKLPEEETKQILENLSKDVDSIFKEIGEPLEPENRDRLIEGIIESIDALTSEIIEKLLI